MTTKDILAFAAALTALLAAGCGRISDPVPAVQEQPMAAPAHFEWSSARMDRTAAQDDTAFEYH